MKYCAYCGKELFDEAVICPGCGCPVKADEAINQDKELDEGEIAKRKKKKMKIIIISAVAICVVVALFFASMPVIKSIKTKKIIKDLNGETFERIEQSTYSYSKSTYTFDDEGNCENYLYLGALRSENTYEWQYEIEFKDGKPYVIVKFHDELKIKYDDNGEIESLYSTKYKETYERR